MCPYSEMFWSAFSRIRPEYGEIRSGTQSILYKFTFVCLWFFLIFLFLILIIWISIILFLRSAYQKKESSCEIKIFHCQSEYKLQKEEYVFMTTWHCICICAHIGRTLLRLCHKLKLFCLINIYAFVVLA